MKRFMGVFVALILIIQSSFSVNAAEYNGSSIEANGDGMESLETITDIRNQTNGVSDFTEFFVALGLKYSANSLCFKI